MIAILPFLIFLEGNKLFAKFLKDKNIYLHWDVYHAFIIILVILFIVLWVKGFRF